MAGRSSSSQGKNKKGMLSFMSHSGASKRPQISTPYNPIHLMHVYSNSSTGELTGLPKEWERVLQKNNRRYQGNNRQAEAEAPKVYQGTAESPGKIAHRYTAPGPTIPQQINGAYGLREALHDS
ncbi:signal transducing kinase of the PAK, partial [Tulasnella sp. 408]